MIPGGILANKYDAKTLLIIGWAISIPLPALFYFSGNWPDVLPGLIILQFSSFNLPAMNSFIRELSDKSQPSAAFGAVYSAAPMGLILSPAVGGLLLNWFRIRDLFWLTLVIWTVSTLVLFPVKRQPPTQADARAPLLELPQSRQDLIILLFLFGATTAIAITYPSFLAVYFQGQLHLTDSQIQWLGSVQALGSTVFTVLLGRWASTRNEGSTISKELLLVAGGAVGIAVVGSPFLAIPMVFLLGGSRAPSPVAYSLLSRMGRGRSRGGQFGFYLTLEQLGFVVGSLIGGVLYTRSPVSVLITTSALFLLLSVFSTVGIRRVGMENPKPRV
jgi:predicted MFS family arabinose efflux permease